MTKSVFPIIVGYLCAVTAAALSQSIWWTVAEMQQHNLGVRPVYALTEMFYFGWIYAFFMALLPFCVGVHLEFWRAINRPLFFMAGAAITGALLVLPRVYFLEGGVFDQTDASFLQRSWNSLPRFATSGLVAGAVYYLVRDFLRTRTSMRQTEPLTPA
jgi:hypothetical protein